MSKLTLKGLRTVRNNWQCDVELYKTSDDAIADGFALMYEDEEGAVYGIRNRENIYSWDQIAFVPYSQFYRKYEGRAIG